MRSQNVDMVIGNNKTFCCDGFDNAVASIFDILIFPEMRPYKAY